MQQLQRALRLTFFFVFFFSLSAACFARQTIVTGGARTGYDFRDRTYDRNQVNSSDDGNVQKIFIGPTITVVSKGIYDTLNFSYSPQLSHDFDDDTNEVEHNLQLSNERFLTQKWSLTLSDTFLLSDDPGLTSNYSGATGSTGTNGQTQSNGQGALSRDLSGRQYWTNAASVQTSYALAENSKIGGGYTYTVLRNEEGDVQTNDDYDEYDRHTFFTNFSYGFNQNWRSNLGLNYTRGLYDSAGQTSGQGTSANTPDLDQYGVDVGLDYVDSAKDFFPLKYSASETQYDGDTRRDTQVHEWSAGWDHAFDPQTHLALGGGPSYVKTQGLDGTCGYNAYLTFTKQYQHSSYSLQFDKRYETDNFSGTDESGVRDTYNARANAAYQLTQALGLDVYGRYSWQSQIDPQGDYLSASSGSFSGSTGDVTYDKNVYEVGAGLRYTFAQWYSAGIKYAYYVSDGELDSDQYTDHLVLFTLSATKEFWRW